MYTRKSLVLPVKQSVCHLTVILYIDLFDSYSVHRLIR
eukprot:COSAG03_NODE_28718_length_194_cov_34963.726316_1_plen_37_part_01